MRFHPALKVSALFLILSTNCSYGKKQPAPHPKDERSGFAVVELFTSEGCFSCPAAEAVLAHVNDLYSDNVLVMEFHVDYWDYIGWKDIFSSKQFTKRQQNYAEHFHLSSTYTPQAIVNGKTEFVGSDRNKMLTAIDHELNKKDNNPIKLSAAVAGNNISVSYSIAKSTNQELNIALVQKNAETDVKRGENKGRKLKHVNVVRALTTVDATQNTGSVDIVIPPGVAAAGLLVIAYTQLKDSREVTCASATQVK